MLYRQNRSQALTRSPAKGIQSRARQKSECSKDDGQPGAQTRKKCAKIKGAALDRAVDHNICEDTARQYLKRREVQKRRPVKKPFLSVAHKKARLQWCKDHRNWSAKDWEKVIWSDDACVRIGEDNSPAWVFRTAKEKYISDCLRPVFKGEK